MAWIESHQSLGHQRCFTPGLQMCPTCGGKLNEVLL
jgi:hypothetical protein